MSNELDKFEIERRLTRLEANTAATNEVVLRMDAKLDMWQSNYYPKEQVNEMFRSRDQQIADIQNDIKIMQSNAQTDKQAFKMTIPSWVLVATSVASVVVTLVVAFH